MGSLTVKLSAGHRERLPISKKVFRYYESFIEENILIPKKIIINSKWDIWLAFILLSGEGKYADKSVQLYASRSTGAENNRFYPITIPVKLITEAENKPLKIAELFFEGIKIFFVKTYKKTDEDFMNKLWEKVDIEYLKSIPYPAHLKDIEYIG